MTGTVDRIARTVEARMAQVSWDDIEYAEIPIEEYRRLKAQRTADLITDVVTSKCPEMLSDSFLQEVKEIIMENSILMHPTLDDYKQWRQSREVTNRLDVIAGYLRPPHIDVAIWRYWAWLIHVEVERRTLEGVPSDRSCHRASTNIRSGDSQLLLQGIICHLVKTQSVGPLQISDINVTLASLEKDNISVLTFPSEWIEIPANLRQMVEAFKDKKPSCPYTPVGVTRLPRQLSPINGDRSCIGFSKVSLTQEKVRVELKPAKQPSVGQKLWDLTDEHKARGLVLEAHFTLFWARATKKNGKPLQAVQEVAKPDSILLCLHQMSLKNHLGQECPKTYRVYTYAEIPELCGAVTRCARYTGANMISELVPRDRPVPLYVQLEWTGSSVREIVIATCRLIQRNLIHILGPIEKPCFWVMEGKALKDESDWHLARIIAPDVFFGSTEALAQFVKLITWCALSDGVYENVIWRTDPCSGKSKECAIDNTIYRPNTELTLLGNTNQCHTVPYKLRPFKWGGDTPQDLLLFQLPEKSLSKYNLKQWYVTRSETIRHTEIMEHHIATLPIWSVCNEAQFTFKKFVELKSHPLRVPLTTLVQSLPLEGHASAKFEAFRIYRVEGSDKTKRILEAFVFSTTTHRMCPDGFQHTPGRFKVFVDYRGNTFYQCFPVDNETGVVHKCTKRFIGFPYLDMPYFGLKTETLPKNIRQITQNQQYVDLSIALDTRGVCALVKSPQGSGKTSAIIQLIPQFKFTVIVCPRISLCTQTLEKLRAQPAIRHVISYMDGNIREMFQVTTVNEFSTVLQLWDSPVAYVTTVESLHLLWDIWMNLDTAEKERTLLCCDEIDTMVKSILSVQTNRQNMTKNYTCLRWMINEAKAKVLCDGELSSATVTWAHSIAGNEAVVLKNIHPGRHRIIELVDDWETDLVGLLNQRERCFVAVTSIDYGQSLSARLKALFNPEEIVFYQRDSSDDLKAELTNVNETWKYYLCVICTNVGSVGLSYDGQGEFHSIFCRVTPSVGDYVEASQIMGRIRHPKSNVIKVSINEAAPVGKQILDMQEQRRLQDVYQCDVIAPLKGSEFETFPEELKNVYMTLQMRQLVWRWCPFGVLAGLCKYHDWELRCTLTEAITRTTRLPVISDTDLVPEQQALWDQFEVAPKPHDRSKQKDALRKCILNHTATDLQKAGMLKICWIELIGPGPGENYDGWKKFSPHSATLFFIKSFIQCLGEYERLSAREKRFREGQWLEIAPMKVHYAPIISQIFRIFGTLLEESHGFSVSTENINRAAEYIKTVKDGIGITLSAPGGRTCGEWQPHRVVNHALQKMLQFCTVKAAGSQKGKHRATSWNVHWDKISGVPVPLLFVKPINRLNP